MKQDAKKVSEYKERLKTMNQSMWCDHKIHVERSMVDGVYRYDGYKGDIPFYDEEKSIVQYWFTMKLSSIAELRSIYDTYWYRTNMPEYSHLRPMFGGTHHQRIYATVVRMTYICIREEAKARNKTLNEEAQSIDLNNNNTFYWMAKKKLISKERLGYSKVKVPFDDWYV